MEALIARPLLSAAPAHDAADLHHSLADVIGTQPPFSIDSLCQHFRIEAGAWPFPETVSGCLIRDGRNYSSGVNGRHSLGRRRFSAAHRLDHFLEHRYLLPHVICTASPEDSHDVLELEANRFAAELLMPQAWVRYLWSWHGAGQARLLPPSESLRWPLTADWVSCESTRGA